MGGEEAGEDMDEALEEVIMAPKDLSQIVKGKRTKRQRLQSPIHNFAMATHSSTSGEGEGNSNYVEFYNTTATTTNNNNNNNNNNNKNYSSSSGEFHGDSVGTTEEDKDTAKCLILLSQGPSQNYPSVPKSNHKNNKISYVGMYKFSSKKYVETPTTGNGKVGIYVYECRTCNRTFPSFQALGGHRASHKKPKNAAEDARRKASAIGSLSDDEEEFLIPPSPPALRSSNNNNNDNNVPFSSSLHQLTGNKNNNNNNGNYKASASSSRAHECSICGAEFTSGQALGGHMRRHRAAVTSITTTTTAAINMALSRSTTPLSSPIAIDSNSGDAMKQAKNSMPLDLNFPAPEDDQHHLHQLNFFASKQQLQPPPLPQQQQLQPPPLPQQQQQQPPPPPPPPQLQLQQKQQQHQQQKQSALVLSAGRPALVDCHY